MVVQLHPAPAMNSIALITAVAVFPERCRRVLFFMFSMVNVVL
jgi:hypothetical protein